ncbi:hypothetical protein EDB81DRAFT_814140 [Dactylonectria macrodidyma]|uniref:Uncharacterized protein n=1 Tax=Dactylonectria macrodidyma TaxID=307937 RepID=A0A9P9DLX7_9HYPO|nr:hypothetical protein EDB81DRAFT_814140 [Dactylonectria macrodidyma]
MPSLSRFMDGFLTEDDVQLGRLVLDTKKPQKNFCKAASLTLTSADRSRRVFENLENLTGATSSSSFLLLFTKILGVLARKSEKSVDTLKTAKAVSYDLYHVDEKFEELLSNEEVKEWLEKYRGRTRIYLVVALHVVQDASVSMDHSESSLARGKATVPVAEAAAGVVARASTLSTVLDPQAEARHGHSHEHSASFFAPGERIIAVGYQEVRFRMFSSTTADAPTLAKKTVWKSFDTSRAAGVLDMMEATVEDASALGKGNEMVAESVGPGGKFVILKDQAVNQD